MPTKYTIQKITVPYVGGGIVDISIPEGWHFIDVFMPSYGNGFGFATIAIVLVRGL